MDTIADMTVDELKQFVQETIDERLTRLLGTFDISDDTDDESGLTWDEIRDAVKRHRWTPPTGGKSALQLLREDRDS